MSLTDALDQALSEADHGNIDAAAVRLARTYAEQLDDATGDLAKIGPRLLDCLEALNLTPRARAKIMKGDANDGQPANPLDELRDRRKRRAATIDATP